MSVAGGCSGVGPAYCGAARRGLGRRRGQARHAGRARHELVTRDDGRRGRAAARPRRRHARRPPRGGLAGRHDRARAGGAGARRRAGGVLERDGRRGAAADVGRVREEIADFVERAHLGLHAHHRRLDRASQFVLLARRRACRTRAARTRCSDFLRDVSEPYLRIFRRLPLRIGPLDLSPIVAILVLRIVGGDHRGPDRSGDTGVARRRCVAAATVAADQADQGARALDDRPRRAPSTSSSASSWSTSATAGSRSGCSPAAASLLVIFAVASRWRRCWCSSAATATGRWCGCRPGCCSAARSGNLIDRTREGAVTDFIELPAVAGVQRRRHGDHVRGADAAVRARGPAAAWRPVTASWSWGRRRPASGSTSSWPARPARARRRSG